MSPHERERLAQSRMRRGPRGAGPSQQAQPRGRQRRGVGSVTGQKKPGQSKQRVNFWAGMIMGAASATGGFFAIRALEKFFKQREEGGAQANPAIGAPTEAQQRLVATATGGKLPTAAPPQPAKAPVVKRTVIEEMVEDLDS